MTNLETTYAPTGSDGGADDAAAGASLTHPGQSASFLPDRHWVAVRLEDANYAFSHGHYEEMRDAIELANAMMRYLELREREEARS